MRPVYKTEIYKFYRIMMITSDGLTKHAEVGYGESLEFIRFATETDAERYLAEIIEDLHFGHEYTIGAVYEKVWSD